MSEDDRVPCSLMVVVVVVVSTIGDNGGCRQSRQVGDKVTESMVAAWPCEMWVVRSVSHACRASPNFTIFQENKSSCRDCDPCRNFVELMYACIYIYMREGERVRLHRHCEERQPNAVKRKE